MRFIEVHIPPGFNLKFEMSRTNELWYLLITDNFGLKWRKKYYFKISLNYFQLKDAVNSCKCFLSYLKPF